MNLGRMLLAGRLAKLAVIAVALLAVGGWWKLSGDPGAPVSVRDEPGVVAEVNEKAYLVRLDSGKSVRVFRSGSAVVGSRVILTATRYENGEESYSLEMADATP